MSLRTPARFGAVLFGGFLAGARLIEAAQAWQEWHRWAVADPSAADLYRTDFWLAGGIAVLTIGLVSLVFWLLRPTVPSPSSGS